MPGPIISPNTVLANVLNQTVDLLRPRLAISRPKRVEIAVGTQINGLPHLGTNLTQCAAFILAREIRNIFSVETNVVFHALDNAPYKIELDPETFHSYQITYYHALGNDRICSLTDDLYREIFEGLSDRTAVDYRIQLYSNQQATPVFRRTFLETLPFKDQLRWCVSPANGIMHVRIPCPNCYKAEKRGERTRILIADKNHAVFEAFCFDHGAYEVLISEDSDSFLDLSTIYRNVVKEAMYTKEIDTLGVMVKGGDWSFACQLVDWSLGVMGYKSTELPVRWFTPQIITETGAKLSKTLIGRNGMPPLGKEHSWIINTKEYNGDIDSYLDFLIAFVLTIIKEPKHFYRSYSYSEVDKIMKSMPAEKLKESRARFIRIYRKYFDLIASGDKTIEVRVGYSSMKKIKPGQLLKFVSQQDSCLTKVIAVREYSSFEELFEHEDSSQINPTLSQDEQIKEIRRIFPPDKEKLGVLAIEIKKLQVHDESV